MPFKTAAAVGALLALSLSVPASAETFRYTAIANGEKVGHLVADVQGRTTKVDYAISNNGRGPKARETIDADAAGFPVSWNIEGESLFGSPVHEHYTWKAGQAEWVSQADKGQVHAAKPLLYIGNDVSPWMLGVYVKALLKAPNRTLPVAPSGSLRLTRCARSPWARARRPSRSRSTNWPASTSIQTMSWSTPRVTSSPRAA